AGGIGPYGHLQHPVQRLGVQRPVAQALRTAVERFRGDHAPAARQVLVQRCRRHRRAGVRHGLELARLERGDQGVRRRLRARAGEEVITYPGDDEQDGDDGRAPDVRGPAAPPLAGRGPPAGTAPAPGRRGLPGRWVLPVRWPAPGLMLGVRLPGRVARPVPGTAALTLLVVRPPRHRSGYRPWRVLLLIIVGIVVVGPVTARPAGGYPSGPRGRRPLLNHGAPPGG